jgi:hypothetical protein
MLLGVAAVIATIVVIKSPLAALPGVVLMIGIIAIAAKFAPVPADPRYSDDLAADRAELPDRREADLALRRQARRRGRSARVGGLEARAVARAPRSAR